MPADRSPRFRAARGAGGLGLAGVLLAGVLLAGCSGPAAPVASPSPVPSAQTSLSIEYVASADDRRMWLLTCQPTGGDHPDPAGACAALTAHGTAALSPVPPGTACTQVYGGPETATVTGIWNGKAVNASLKRSDGCEIARWAALEPLLPKPVR